MLFPQMQPLSGMLKKNDIVKLLLHSNTIIYLYFFQNELMNSVGDWPVLGATCSKA